LYIKSSNPIQYGYYKKVPALEAFCYTMLMVRHAQAHKHITKKQKRSAFDNFIYVFAFTTPLFELP